jgi:hypothetical protein
MMPAARTAAKLNQPRKKNSVHAAVNTRSMKRPPANLALKHGDTSRIRPIMSTVLTLFPLYASD